MDPRRARLAFVAVLSVVVAGCSDSNDAVEEQGEEGQACFRNSTCMPGLTCVSDVCIAAGADSGNAQDAHADATAQDSAATDSAISTGDSGKESDGSAPEPDAATPVDVDEPNGNKTWAEDKTIATILPLATPHQGWISFKGDEDFYKISVTKSGTLHIVVTTAEATPVDLWAELYCPQHNSWGKVVQHDGSAGPTSITKDIKVDASITKTYYLLVHDENDDDVDPIKPYTLTVTLK